MITKQNIMTSLSHTLWPVLYHLFGRKMSTVSLSTRDTWFQGRTGEPDRSHGWIVV